VTTQSRARPCYMEVAVRTTPYNCRDGSQHCYRHTMTLRYPEIRRQSPRVETKFCLNVTPAPNPRRERCASVVYDSHFATVPVRRMCRRVSRIAEAIPAPSTSYATLTQLLLIRIANRRRLAEPRHFGGPCLTDAAAVEKLLTSILVGCATCITGSTSGWVNRSLTATIWTERMAVDVGIIPCSVDRRTPRQG
jgi:hypothetical protein